MINPAVFIGAPLSYKQFKIYPPKVKEVEILQMIICGDKEVIAEVILKEDFEKYFERSNT